MGFQCLPVLPEVHRVELQLKIRRIEKYGIYIYMPKGKAGNAQENEQKEEAISFMHRQMINLQKINFAKITYFS